MADVKKYTDQIAKAQKGRDVRNAIVAAINEVSDENNYYNQAKATILAAQQDVSQKQKDVAEMASKIDNAESTIEQAGQKQIQAIADSLDSTLTAEGKAANAKIVGENFNKVNEMTDSLKEDLAKLLGSISYRDSTNLLGSFSKYSGSYADVIGDVEDELFSFNGTASTTRAWIYTVNEIKLKANKTYFLNNDVFNSSQNFTVTLRDTNAQKVANAYKKNSFSFTPAENVTVKYLYVTLDAGTMVNTTGHIWLNETATKEYEHSGVIEYRTGGDINFLKENTPVISDIVNAKNFLVSSAKTPIITWIDDDTVRSSSKGITFVKALADELGIKCTFACITNTISGDDAYSVATKNLLLEYQKEGFQIVSHSATHDAAWKPSSSDYSTNHIEEEITESICILKEKGFLQCDYLVTPFGAHTTEVQNIASKWCKCLINAGGAEKYNKLYGNGIYDINRVFISSVEHSNADYYTSIIDEAIINGGWVVFGTHSGMNAESGGWSAELVKKVLQYAKDKSVRIATLSEAFKIRKPIYDLYDMFN